MTLQEQLADLQAKREARAALDRELLRLTQDLKSLVDFKELLQTTNSSLKQLSITNAPPTGEAFSVAVLFAYGQTIRYASNSSADDLLADMIGAGIARAEADISARITTINEQLQ